MREQRRKTPAVAVYPSGGGRRVSSGCRECGGPIDLRKRVTTAFCSARCRYRFRDRRRYLENPEREGERSRRYFAENREAVLARAAAKRNALRGERPELRCSECESPLVGRQRVVCSRRCKDARYRRLHPEAYAAKQRRKVERRRASRRGNK
jgi:endogenous inhibitor of DNA gyrase (YacG/DUF329 family)